MKFYDADRSLYLETNSSGIGPGDGSLQVRDGMNCGHDKILYNTILVPTAFASKSLSSAEQSYSSIECEALGILHWVGKFHHYCFMKKVCIITNHKPLVAILSKDVMMLSS